MRRDDRLDILYVGPLPPHRGGAAVVGAQILGALAARGHVIQTLTPVTPELLANRDAVTLYPTSLQVSLLSVPSVERLPEGAEPDEFPDEYARIEPGQIRRALERLIAQRRPDVLMIGREPLMVHVARVASAHAVPTVLLIHNTTNVRYMEQDRPATAARAAWEHYRQATILLVVAEHLGTRVRALGFPDVRVVENSIDPRLFVPRPSDPTLRRSLNIAEDDVVVAHLSNLKGWKRPLDLVFSAVQALRRDPRLIYLIVGDGMMRPAMEEACRQSVVMDRFRFAGWVDRAHVPAYLQLADIVAMPSEAEARALVYLEAQACGRLLVASDVPAAREVIQNGETGLLFRKGDVEDLTAKTLLAAGDASLRAHIGMQARRAAETRSHNAMIDTYEATLREVSRRGEHQKSRWERERV